MTSQGVNYPVLPRKKLCKMAKLLCKHKDIQYRTAFTHEVMNYMIRASNLTLLWVLLILTNSSQWENWRTKYKLTNTEFIMHMYNITVYSITDCV